MPSMLEMLCEKAFQAALESPFGVELEVRPRDANVTAPAMKAKGILYRFRQGLGPEYSRIQIRLSPRDPDRFLWLVNRPAGEKEPPCPD